MWFYLLFKHSVGYEKWLHCYVLFFFFPWALTEILKYKNVYQVHNSPTFMFVLLDVKADYSVL